MLYCLNGQFLLTPLSDCAIVLLVLIQKTKEVAMRKNFVIVFSFVLLVPLAWIVQSIVKDVNASTKSPALISAVYCGQMGSAQVRLDDVVSEGALSSIILMQFSAKNRFTLIQGMATDSAQQWDAITLCWDEGTAVFAKPQCQEGVYVPPSLSFSSPGLWRFKKGDYVNESDFWVISAILSQTARIIRKPEFVCGAHLKAPNLFP